MKHFKCNNLISFFLGKKLISVLLANNLGINNLIKLVYSAQKIRQSIMTDLLTFPPANKWDGNFKTNKIMHFTNSVEREIDKLRCHWHRLGKKICRVSNYLSRFLFPNLLPAWLHLAPSSCFFEPNHQVLNQNKLIISSYERPTGDKGHQMLYEFSFRLSFQHSCIPHAAFYLSETKMCFDR